MVQSEGPIHSMANLVPTTPPSPDPVHAPRSKKGHTIDISQPLQAFLWAVEDRPAGGSVVLGVKDSCQTDPASANLRSVPFFKPWRGWFWGPLLMQYEEVREDRRRVSVGPWRRTFCKQPFCFWMGIRDHGRGLHLVQITVRCRKDIFQLVIPDCASVFFNWLEVCRRR